MEEIATRMKVLQAFLKFKGFSEKKLQEEIDSFRKSSDFVSDRSLSFAESLDKVYIKAGVNPIKRKFWTDFFCGLTPEIENEEELRDEILFYWQFKIFELAQRMRISGLEPLY